MTRVLIDDESDLVSEPTIVPVIDQWLRWPLQGYEYVVELPSGRRVIVQQEEALTVN